MMKGINSTMDVYRRGTYAWKMMASLLLTTLFFTIFYIARMENVEIRNREFNFVSKDTKKPETKSNCTFGRQSKCKNVTRKVIVYPNDFVIFSYIQSADLVRGWSDGNYRSSFCNADAQTVDLENSKMFIRNIDYDVNVVYLVIVLYDHINRPRQHGGDVIFVWAESDMRVSAKSGRVSGSIVDYLNGTYMVTFKMLWSGPVIIKAKVAALSGVTCLRLQAMHKYGNSVFAVNTPYGIHFQFQNGSTIETTRCSPNKFIFGYNHICNFTKLNFNLSWYCGKPNSPYLKCSHFKASRNLPYNKHDIVPGQLKKEVINVPISKTLPATVEMKFKRENDRSNQSKKPLCAESPELDSWTVDSPSGYSINGHWRLVHCKTSPASWTVKYLRSCLRKKTLLLLGDSTLRQYCEDIASMSNTSYARTRDFAIIKDATFGINIAWRKHEMPYHHKNWIPKDGIGSVVMQIHKLADDAVISGTGLILVVHYNAHLQAFSPEVYRNRLIRLVESIKYVLSKKPGIKVFVKGPHVPFDDRKYFDARITLIFRDIIFEEFYEIRHRVTYLDTLSISIAHNNGKVHPSGDTLRSQTEAFLSYIC